MTTPTATQAALNAAYRQGVADVIALARRSADALQAGTTRPLAVGFGVEALRALADEAEALIRAAAVDFGKVAEDSDSHG